MDIAGVSMALSQIDAKGDIGVAMLSKAIDANKTAGDGIVSLIDKSSMERSVNPTVGSNVDEYV